MSIKQLAQTIATRKHAYPDTSWTAKLLTDPDKATEKFGEEAVEAIIEATKGDKARLTSEAADVMYHLLVMLHLIHISVHKRLRRTLYAVLFL